MKVFYMKQLFLILSIGWGAQICSGWPDTFKAQATSFFQDRIKPVFQKPETYAVLGGVAAIAAAVVYREDIYWAFQSELPYERAEQRVRTQLLRLVKDQDQVDALAQHVKNNAGIVSRVLAEKTSIDLEVEKAFVAYEYGDARSADWVTEHGNFEVCKHAVKHQSGLTCGYHALRNGAEIYGFLTDPRNHQTNNVQYDPPLQAWKECVYSRFLYSQSNGSLENITDAALEYLRQNELGALLPKDDMTIISSISQYTPTLDRSLALVVQALQEGSKTAHVFLVNTARDNGNYGGTGGHWTAAVAQSYVDDQGRRRIKMHTADSLGSDCRNQVERLAEILTGDPEWYQILPDVDRELSSAETLSDQENYNLRKILKCIRDALAHVTRVKKQNHPDFRGTYLSRMRALVLKLQGKKPRDGQLIGISNWLGLKGFDTVLRLLNEYIEALKEPRVQGFAASSSSANRLMDSDELDLPGASAFYEDESADDEPKQICAIDGLTRTGDHIIDGLNGGNYQAETIVFENITDQRLQMSLRNFCRNYTSLFTQRQQERLVELGIIDQVEQKSSWCSIL